MNIKYLSNLQALSKLHEEYAIFGISSADFKELKLDTFKRKNKKMSDAERNFKWKKYHEVKEWGDKILIYWSEKYHSKVFTLNKMPETGVIRRKLDNAYLYVFTRKSREANETNETA